MEGKKGPRTEGTEDGGGRTEVGVFVGPCPGGWAGDLGGRFVRLPLFSANTVRVSRGPRRCWGG